MSDSLNFAYTDEQTALRDLAARLFADTCDPEQLRRVEETDDAFQADVWAELGALGLLGAAIGERNGGLGLSLEEVAIVATEAGAALPKIPFIESSVAAMALDTDGCEHGAKLLRGLVEGTAVGTVAFVEPGSNRPSLPAAHVVDGAMTGVKTVVPYGHVADVMVTTARDADGQVGLYAVALRREGVAVEQQRVTSFEAYAHIELTGARAARIGDADAIDKARQRYEVLLCAHEAGLTKRALRMTAKFVTEREQFGVPVGSFQAVKQRIGDAFIAVQTIELSYLEALHLVRTAQPAERAIATARYWASLNGFVATIAAQHLHGGVGVDKDYPLYRYYAKSRQNEVTLGSAPASLARLGDILASA